MVMSVHAAAAWPSTARRAWICLSFSRCRWPVTGVTSASSRPLARRSCADVVSRCGPPRLPVVAPAADRPPGRAQQQQDQADYEDDDAECPRNRDLGQEADKQQDDAEDDH